ncbi:MAG: MFS transporter [Novosphingobium sp.]|nr:MFS transporter [Novosphingobium sp.]
MSASAVPETASAAQEWRRSWTVVLAGALGFALSSVTTYSLGPFIAPLEAEFGWSRAEIASGMTLYAILGIVLAPLAGAVIDRLGARRVGLFAILSYGVTFCLLSLATASLWLWLALWFVLSIASAPMKPTTWTAGVSSVFDKGRGLAISVMLCGAALGSTLTPIYATWLIDTYGWRFAYVAMIGTFVAVVFPVVYLFFTSAADRLRVAERGGTDNADAKPAAPLTGLAWREGLLSWKFARLGGAAFVTTLVIISFVSNFIPIFSASGIPRAQAAGIAGLIGISTVVGRLIGGYLLDRINGGIVGGVSLLAPAISAMLVLANPGSVTMASAAVLILGLSLGAELDCVAYLTTRHFGLKNFGTIFGVISGILALATGLGPFFVNLAYDMTGSYTIALEAYVPLALLASALFFSLGRYPQFVDEPKQEAA